MKAKIKPDLSLFKGLVKASDIYLLKRMRGIINRQIINLEPETNHTKTDANEISTSDGLLFTTPKLALTSLLREDWSDLFTGIDNDHSDYYVYYHSNPTFKSIKFRYETSYIDMKVPFYIGMGRGKRIYSYARSVMHTNYLNTLSSEGYTNQEIMRFYQRNLTKKDALILESKLILFFGIKTAIPDAKIKKGTKAYSGHKPSLLNNRYEPFPDSHNSYAYNGTKFN